MARKEDLNTMTERIGGCESCELENEAMSAIAFILLDIPASCASFRVTHATS